jgi:hypothetical protein
MVNNEAKTPNIAWIAKERAERTMPVEKTKTGKT